MNDNQHMGHDGTSRRSFLRGACAAALSSGVTNGLAARAAVHNGSSETLRIGLVGCGSRGTGAAANAMKADDDVKLVAMADMFDDRLQASRKRLAAAGGESFAVDDERCFSGFDAYKQLLKCGVDVVVLGTPPHFRPAHLKAAVEAGKHVFAEKPVAVDAPGVRSVMTTCEAAQEKGLSIVSGLMLRYSTAMREMMGRIHEGGIGQITALQANYNIGGLWLRVRQEGWSDMEWQLRNWYYFTWLSGDHNVEQHVHGLDLMSWAMQGQYPKQCFGLGGRQARTAPQYGHIFDHHAVCYEFESGVRCFSYCRQQPGAAADTSHLVFGQTGTANLSKHTTTGETTWRYSRAQGGPRDVPYQQEQDALFASIRSGEPINNGEYMAKSTMMAIMGRMATYTGQVVTWDQAWNSEEDLTPTAYEFGLLPVPPVAVPGVTKLR